MNAEGGMGGSSLFLEPIPEDVSVAANQHAVNSSIVSAVVSSSSEVVDQLHGNNVGGSKTTDKVKTWGGGKHRRRRGGGEESEASNSLGVDGPVGARVEAADNVSEANASLGGAHQDEGDAVEIRLDTYSQPVQTVLDHTSKSLFTSLNCKKYSSILLGIIAALAIAIGVGMYIILVKLPEDEAKGIAGPTSSPTTNLAFPPIGDQRSFAPIPTNEFDKALLGVHGTNEDNLFDLSTPEGKSRDWMIHSDDAIDFDNDVEQRAQQRYILCVLYYTTNGTFWTNSTDWMDSDLSECEWHGVVCDGNSFIREIDLSDNNITGPIPYELGSLSSLKFLNMSFNLLSNTIPEEFFDLLEGMEKLDLQKNRITGSIPKRTDSKSALTYLNMDDNQARGYFPFFSNLRTIKIDSNRIESIDIQYWTSSPSLKEFHAYNNKLSGPLPTEWDSPDLVHLDLGSNLFTGTIPQVLWDLSLEKLFLDGCNFTGTLPGESRNTKMQQLWLHSNLLSGSIPSNFGSNWKSLFSLQLQNNLLTGDIDSEMCNNWEKWSTPALNAVAVQDESSLTPQSSKNNHVSSTNKEWTCKTDCEIDCACCTNSDCEPSSSNTGNNNSGRRRR